MGLQAVTAAHEEEPDSNFEPNNGDPDHLRIERPNVTFVLPGQGFGMLGGETVRKPSDVQEAVSRGMKYVLETGRSYVLEVRTDKETPAPPPPASSGSGAPLPARHAQQQPLGVFHHGAAPQVKATVYDHLANVQVIF